MITTDELRRVLGPLGIWMPPPAWIGIDPEAYAREIETAGFTSVWYPGVNSPADLAAIEPALAATERLVVATGIASVWTWAAADLAAAAGPARTPVPGAVRPRPRGESRAGRRGDRAGVRQAGREDGAVP